jgi:hypothetical protein
VLGRDDATVATYRRLGDVLDRTVHVRPLSARRKLRAKLSIRIDAGQPDSRRSRCRASPGPDFC